jgi:hypothetical protein
VLKLLRFPAVGTHRIVAFDDLAAGTARRVSAVPQDLGEALAWVEDKITNWIRSFVEDST